MTLTSERAGELLVLLKTALLRTTGFVDEEAGTLDEVDFTDLGEEDTETLILQMTPETSLLEVASQLDLKSVEAQVMMVRLCDLGCLIDEEPLRRLVRPQVRDLREVIGDRAVGLQTLGSHLTLKEMVLLKLRTLQYSGEDLRVNLGLLGLIVPEEEFSRLFEPTVMHVLELMEASIP